MSDVGRGSRVSGVGVRFGVSSVRCCVSGAGCQVSGLRCQVSCVGMTRILTQVSDVIASLVESSTIKLKPDDGEDDDGEEEEEGNVDQGSDGLGYG